MVNYFLHSYSKRLKESIELLMKSLGEQVLKNKFRMGHFTGIRKLVEWMSPSHAKWIDDFMPNTSVIGPKGKGMRIKNLLKLTLGSLQALLVTIPGKVLNKCNTQLLKNDR